MEVYEGVKFHCHCEGRAFEFDKSLVELHRWSYLLSELGLTPLHPQGASGNLSCRRLGESFYVTKSGMIPEKVFSVSGYTLVQDYDEVTETLVFRGESSPSSESVMHSLIYRQFPEVKAVMHGHSGLFLQFSEILGIPVTKEYCEYGTRELALSILEILSETQRFALLRDHGFVAIGDSMDLAGGLVLEKYSELLEILRNETGGLCLD